MEYLFETERLAVRLLHSRDTSFLVELLNSPGWLKYIGDRNVKTVQQAMDYLTHGPLKSYQTLGFGLWLVEEKQNGTSLGICGMVQRDYLTHPDLGFAFLPEVQGQGYGYEVAAATIQFVRKSFDTQKLFAITKPNNQSSIRLLTKLGFQKISTLSVAQEELDLFSLEF